MGDSAGTMELRGTAFGSRQNIESENLLYSLSNNEGEVVAGIDADGNLYLMGLTPTPTPTPEPTPDETSEETPEPTATPTPAGPPEPVTARAVSSGEIAIYWDRNFEPASGRGYKVYRATTSGGAYANLTPNSITSTYYLDKLVNPDTEYYYVVKSVFPVDVLSADSIEVYAKTMANPSLQFEIVDTNEADISVATATPTPAASLSIAMPGEEEGSGGMVSGYLPRTQSIGTYCAGSELVIKAGEVAGYRFLHWKEDGVLKCEDPIHITMSQESKVLRAVYAAVGVVSVSPPNERIWPRPCSADSSSDPIRIRFCREMAAASDDKLGNSIIAYGSQSGRLKLEYKDGSGIPDMQFSHGALRPGEIVSVVLKQGFMSAAPESDRLTNPYVWRYMARPGPGTRMDGTNETVYGGAVKLGDERLPVTCIAVGDLMSEGQVHTVVGCNGALNRVYYYDRENKSDTIKYLYNYGIDKGYISGDRFVASEDHTGAIVLADMNPKDLADGAGSSEVRDDAHLLDYIVGGLGERSYVYIAGFGALEPNGDVEDIYKPYILRCRIGFGPADGVITALAAGDVDGDGNQDIVASFKGMGGAIYYNNANLQTGAPQFVERWFGDSKRDYSALVLADMNHDGSLDIVASVYDGQSGVYLNNGAEGFAAGEDAAYSYAIGRENSRTKSLAVGDFDNNEYPDVVLGNYLEPIEVYINNKNNTFTETEMLDGDQRLIRTTVSSILLGDYNGDGFLDMAIGCSDNRPSRVILSGRTGDDIYLGASEAVVGNTVALAAGDYDNDGDLDIAAANSDQQSYIYLCEPHLPMFSIGRGYVYDWAVKKSSTMKIDTTRLSLVDQSYKEGSPAIATDNMGHWMAAWASGNRIAYGNNVEHPDRFRTVVSRYWDRKPREENRWDPLGSDAWKNLCRLQTERNTDAYPNAMDDSNWLRGEDPDTGWTVPWAIQGKVEEVEKSYAYADVVADGHGNWMVACASQKRPIGVDGIADDYIKDEFGNLRADTLTIYCTNDKYGPGTWSIPVPEISSFKKIGAPRIACDGLRKSAGTGNWSSNWMIAFPAVTGELSATGAGHYDIYYMLVTMTDDSSGIQYSPLGPAPISATYPTEANSGNPNSDDEWFDDGRTDLSPNHGREDIMPSINTKCVGLDIAADGAGHWVAVWESTRRIFETTNYQNDHRTVYRCKKIMYSLLTQEGETVTPGDANVIGLDVSTDDPHQDGWFEGTPSVEYSQGRWIAAWKKSFYIGRYVFFPAFADRLLLRNDSGNREWDVGQGI